MESRYHLEGERIVGEGPRLDVDWLLSSAEARDVREAIRERLDQLTEPFDA